MSKYVYGIDLGTTYSCIAYQDENGMSVVVQNMEGDNTTPSVISLINEDEPIVGQVAKDQAEFDADYTLSYVKNYIGRKENGTGNPCMIYYGENSEKEIDPTVASSYILKKLADDAGRLLDDEVKAVVITVPAYFNNEQRLQTQKAGEMVGLEVLSVIDEPTAAAICYGCSRDADGKTFLVYDLGGGTFDITVMRIEGGKFTVVCSEGDHDLGGGVWDQAIYEYVENKYREMTGDEEEFNTETVQELKITCEKAKKMLTQKDSYTILIRTPNDKAKIELTREVFDDITAVFLEKTITLTKKAIAVAQGFATYTLDSGETKEKTMDEIVADFDANFDSSQIDEILLVGGSTRMPQVEAKVESVFGLKTVQFDPDQAVAKGAAIYACLQDQDIFGTSNPSPGGTSNPSPIGTTYPLPDMPERVKIGGDSKLPPTFENVNKIGGGTKIEIQNSLNKSYGVRITRYTEEYPSGHECVNLLLKRDTLLPAETKATYGLSCDNQTSIKLEIYEVPSRDDYVEIDADNLILLREVDIPAGLKEDDPVDVKMALSQDGMIAVELGVGGQNIPVELKVDLTLQ